MSAPIDIRVGSTFGDWECVEIGVVWRGRKFIRVQCACGRRKLIPPGAFKIARSCKDCSLARTKQHDRALPLSA